MRRAAILLALALLALAGVASGCGEEDEGEHEVVEGEPLELGELQYNVQLTRFLNSDDIEDAEYLVDQPSPPPDTSFLGVFMTILNEGDEELGSATDYVVSDIRGESFEPVASESPYALEIGEFVPPDGELPSPDSTAANGPAAGALLLFLVDDAVIDSRPVSLEIESDEGAGEVELDI